MVGPDFEKPAAPDVARYSERPDPIRLTVPGTPATQTFAFGEAMPQAWWTLFGSRRLDALVRQGLAASPDVALAEATLRQAQSFTVAAQAGLLPSVFATTSRSGSGRFDGRMSVASLYNGNLAVSYVPDLFGGVRRGIEVNAALETATAERLSAAGLALSVGIVTAAI